MATPYRMCKLPFIISHDLTEALSHIHFKGFLHCDLKFNHVLESNKHGYIIDFGKACDSSFPPAKKYSIAYGKDLLVQ